MGTGRENERVTGGSWVSCRLYAQLKAAVVVGDAGGHVHAEHRHEVVGEAVRDVIARDLQGDLSSSLTAADHSPRTQPLLAG